MQREHVLAQRAKLSEGDNRDDDGGKDGGKGGKGGDGNDSKSSKSSMKFSMSGPAAKTGAALGTTGAKERSE